MCGLTSKIQPQEKETDLNALNGSFRFVGDKDHIAMHEAQCYFLIYFN